MKNHLKPLIRLPKVATDPISRSRRGKTFFQIFCNNPPVPLEKELSGFMKLEITNGTGALSAPIFSGMAASFCPNPANAATRDEFRLSIFPPDHHAPPALPTPVQTTPPAKSKMSRKQQLICNF